MTGPHYPRIVSVATCYCMCGAKLAGPDELYSHLLINMPPVSFAGRLTYGISHPLPGHRLEFKPGLLSDKLRVRCSCKMDWSFDYATSKQPTVVHDAMVKHVVDVLRESVYGRLATERKDS